MNFLANLFRRSSSTHGVPNLLRVDSDIWRGGQPTAEGWAWLYAQGVRIAVKLNYEPEGAPPDIAIVVASMPPEGISDAENRPDDAVVRKAVDALIHHGAGGAYVHCDHGQDRTGLIVALYRLACGWSRHAARREMLSNGFHPIFLGLDDVWEDWK